MRREKCNSKIISAFSAPLRDLQLLFTLFNCKKISRRDAACAEKSTIQKSSPRSPRRCGIYNYSLRSLIARKFHVETQHVQRKVQFKNHLRVLRADARFTITLYAL